MPDDFFTEKRPWSRVKDGILRYYMDAYLRKVKALKQHILLVDTFAGPGARPMKKAWVIEIRDQCQSAGVAFFFKQWGGVNKKRRGRTLDGRTWDAMPREGI